MSAELYSAQLKVRNKLGGPKSRIMALTSVLFSCQNCLVPTQHGGEVPLKLVVVTLCPGDQLFDTLVLVSGVIQQVGDSALSSPSGHEDRKQTLPSFCSGSPCF